MFKTPVESSIWSVWLGHSVTNGAPSLDAYWSYTLHLKTRSSNSRPDSVNVSDVGK